MQNCTNELYWMDTQEEDRLRYDWSDQNLDYKSRYRQYEVTANTEISAQLRSWGAGVSGKASVFIVPPLLLLFEKLVMNHLLEPLQSVSTPRAAGEDLPGSGSSNNAKTEMDVLDRT
eukprot:g27207.t1